MPRGCLLYQHFPALDIRTGAVVLKLRVEPLRGFLRIQAHLELPPADLPGEGKAQ